jgi:hypothetical protein
VVDRAVVVVVQPSAEDRPEAGAVDVANPLPLDVHDLVSVILIHSMFRRRAMRGGEPGAWFQRPVTTKASS